MQLKLKRTQGSKGMINKSVTFTLHAKADLSEEEKHNVDKYKLGEITIYNSESTRKHAQEAMASTSFTGKLAHTALTGMSLSVTVNSLTRGQDITCKTLDEVLGAEEAVREGCATLKQYLEIAATFDGREEVVEY